MTRLRSLIKEILSNPKKKDCNCGCNTCGDKAPILTEGKFKSLISEGLQHHIDKKISLFESVYRIGSEKHLELIREARALWIRGIIEVSDDDKGLLETHLGHFGLYEGVEVPLDLPMVNEEKDKWVVYDTKTKKRLPNAGKIYKDRKAAQAFADKQENAEVASDTFYFDKIQKKESLEERINEGKIDRVVGGRPYDYVGDGRKGQAIVSGPMKDREKEAIIKRAKEAGYIAKPNMGGGVTIQVESLNEEMGEWPKELTSRYSDEYRFELEKVSPTYQDKPGRAKYRVIDIESGELKGTPVFEKPESLMAFADDLIKPQGGTQSSNFGESLEERIVNILEAKKKKKKEKKDPPLNKPKRGGSKAYYVYVRDPKTKKIKKVSFGSGGLRAKIKNKEARNAFAARHNCKNKKDRTMAGYWSCNLPRYAEQLGLGSKMNTFW